MAGEIVVLLARHMPKTGIQEWSMLPEGWELRVGEGVSLEENQNGYPSEGQ